MELVADNRAGIEAHLRRLGWIGDSETVQSLEIPGDGNMNRTLRARLRPATGEPERTFILKQAVPYVAKYPQIAAPVDRLTAEAAFYRLIAASASLCRHTPALLGEDPDEHLLCLEDLGDGGDLTTLYADGAGAGHDNELGALTTWLGTLHGLAVDPARVPENRDMRSLNHDHIFEVPFDPDNGVALSAPLRAQQARLAGDAAVRRQARMLGELYLGTGGKRSGRPTLLHGDYYPGSWLTHATRTVAVIDPEFAFLGPPEFDVGVFTAHLIMAGCSEDRVAGQLTGYARPPGFSEPLARAFAGIEIIRRLLGVAQLPLSAGDDTRVAWLGWAREAMTP